MKNLVDTIKSLVDVGCLGRTMKKKVGKNFCEVDISKQKGKWIVIDLDKERSLIDKQSLRPDFVFVSNKPIGKGSVVVVEISMGKNKSANDVQRQIQSGFDILEKRLLETSSKNSLKNIEFIGLFCGKPPKALREKLSKTGIRFRNTIVMIKVLHCGESLEKAFETH